MGLQHATLMIQSKTDLNEIKSSAKILIKDKVFDSFRITTKRNDKKHQNATRLLWSQVLQWTDSNKISIEDLEIELSQMLPVKQVVK